MHSTNSHRSNTHSRISGPDAAHMPARHTTQDNHWHPQDVKRTDGRSIVTGSSYVTYSVDDGPAQTGLLCLRARAGSDSGIIPATSNLGAVLIGMRAGQHASFRREDGAIVPVQVLAIAPTA